MDMHTAEPMYVKLFQSRFKRPQNEGNEHISI